MAVNQVLKNIISAIKFKYQLKQVDVAEKIGVKNTYLSDLINGRSPVSELFTDKLVSAFSVNREYLNTGQGEIFEGDKKEEQNPPDMITMSREVFELIKKQSDTILSQQRTIEMMQEERKKMLVHTDANAVSAAVNG